MPKPRQQQHRHFGDGDSDGLPAGVAEDMLENLHSTAATASGSKRAAESAGSDHSDASDDDDDAPEAVQASSAKSSERERLAKLQSLQAASKQAKRKRDGALKLQKKQSKSDRKGKGRADMEDVDVQEDEEQEDSHSQMAIVKKVSPKAKHHQVFGSDDEQEASTSSAPRLDPALFQQAELALQQAKERALQDERNQRREEARLAEVALDVQGSSRKRASKRSRTDGNATRVIGDTIIQQVAPQPRAGQANIDPATSLTPKHNEKFLKDRLFKRRRARVSTKSGSRGQTKEEKPFLLFDPLLDKPKQKKEAKSLTRSEMEERMRYRKSAQTTFSKSQNRLMGPSVAFGTSASGKSGRAFQQGSAL